jgi:hypothetical protein
MLPNPKNYALFPSVVKVGEKTKLSIVATERAFMFFENAEYTLDIIGVNTDVIDYRCSTINNRTTISLVAKGGYIAFDYKFDEEMEYVLSLRKDGKLVQDFYLYAVESDLYELTPLRGDFHSHSYRSDGLRDAVAHAGHYREQGYDFVALTDHNRYYPGGESDEVFAGVNTGFARVFGEEVHCPGSVVHIVHVGGKESVAERYVLDKSGTYNAEIVEYEAKVPSFVPEKYKAKYARAMWACDAIHKVGGLAIFAHPYWRLNVKCYNVCDELSEMLLTSGMFDAYELVGSMGYAGVNLSVSHWAQLRANGLKISVVGSSDVHKIEKSPDFPVHFTVCFAKSNDNDSIIEAIKNGYSVAVETADSGYDLQHRCYGEHRLVMYAHFLLKNYFPERMRIIEGEGVSMRQYAMEDAPKELIELIAKQGQNFTDRFFGKKEPVLPSKKMLEFEEKWRKAQVEKGPNSKGSAINLEVPNFQL